MRLDQKAARKWGHGTHEHVVLLEVLRECVLGVREMIDLKSRGLLLAIRSDFRAARKILSELAITTGIGGMAKIELHVVTIAKGTRKIETARAGREGTVVADTSSTDEGSVYGWFWEADCAGDFQKASDAFRRTGAPWID